jgi:hypothetical protein
VAGTNVASGSAVDLLISTGSSSAGRTGGTGGYGGGGGIDALTLGVLLGSLILGLPTAGAAARKRLGLAKEAVARRGTLMRQTCALFLLLGAGLAVPSSRTGSARKRPMQFASAQGRCGALLPRRRQGATRRSPSGRLRTQRTRRSPRRFR